MPDENKILEKKIDNLDALIHKRDYYLEKKKYFTNRKLVLAQGVVDEMQVKLAYVNDLKHSYAVMSSISTASDLDKAFCTDVMTAAEEFIDKIIREIEEELDIYVEYEKLPPLDGTDPGAGGGTGPGTTDPTVPDNTKRDFIVQVTWDHGDNPVAKQPKSVSLNILVDGVSKATIELNAANEWKKEYKNLSKYSDGAHTIEIAYTVALAEEFDNYKATINEGNVTLAYFVPVVMEKTTVSATMVWNHGTNTEPANQPDDIVVNLLADGEVITSFLFNNELGWRHDFCHLNKTTVAGGTTDVVYTLQLARPIIGYNTVIDNATGTITNTFIETAVTTAKKDITVNAVWSGDDADQSGRTDLAVKLTSGGQLVQTIQLNELNNWSQTVSVDKYSDPVKLIEKQYAIAQDLAVTNYAVTYNGFTVELAYQATPVVIPVISYEIKKEWNHGTNLEVNRPKAVTLVLKADGVQKDTHVVSDFSGWKHTFVNLPETQLDGTPIVYSADEADVTDYTKSINGNIITNTYIEPTATMKDVEVKVVWTGDDEDQSGRTEVIAKLLADGVETKSITLNEDNGWTQTVNVNQYSDHPTNAVEIVYTVAEDVVVANYNITYNGTTIEAAYQAPVPPTMEKTTFAVNKVWEHGTNDVAQQPTEVTVKLFADAVEVPGSETVLNEDNGWAHTYTDLDKTTVAGGTTDVVYTVDEDPVTGYTKGIVGGTITNTYIEPVTPPTEVKKDVTVNVAWTGDDEDQSGRTEVIAKLLADGTEVQQITLNEDNGWTQTVNVNQYSDHPTNLVEIVYTITEDITVENYNITYNGTTIEAAYQAPVVPTMEKTTFAVSMVWNHGTNTEPANQPTEVTVTLKADAVEKDVEALNNDNGWAHTFVDLDKTTVAGGNVDVVYTIEADPITGYDTEINGGVITATFIEPTMEKTTFAVNKIWENGTNANQPTEVTVKLFADAVEVPDSSIVLNEGNGWAHTYTDLNKTTVAGGTTDVVYTVDEEEVTAYNKNIVGGTITNTYIEPTKKNVEVKVVWTGDDEDQSGRTDVTAKLLADGVEAQQITLNEGNNWTDNVEVNQYSDHPTNAVEIVYSLTEDVVVANYNITYNGTTIEAAYQAPVQPATKQITVSAVYTEADGIEDGRQDITVNLMADGVLSQQVELNGGNGYTQTLTVNQYSDHPTNAVEIVYTIEENVAVADYAVTYDQDTLTVKLDK